MHRLALFALALALAVPAAAQTPQPVKKSFVDFTQVVIIGDLVRPTTTYCPARTKRSFRNLIQLRGNFRPELARTASKLP